MLSVYRNSDLKDYENVWCDYALQLSQKPDTELVMYPNSSVVDAVPVVADDGTISGEIGVENLELVIFLIRSQELRDFLHCTVRGLDCMNVLGNDT
jgi:hypothetical protein